MGHFGLGEALLYRASIEHVESGSLVDEGMHELREAAILAPDRSEPILKLASKLSSTNIEAAKDFYQKAVKSSEAETEPFYPYIYQAADHWQFAISAAEEGLDNISIEAFCRAIKLNPNDFSGYFMPSPPRANMCWQSALRKLGKAEWFDKQQEQNEELLRKKGRIVNVGFIVLVAVTVVIILIIWWWPLMILSLWVKIVLTFLAPIIGVLVAVTVSAFYWRDL